MRLLSILLTSAGFLLFAIPVSKLVATLKNSTTQLVHRFNDTNMQLNLRSQQRVSLR